MNKNRSKKAGKMPAFVAIAAILGGIVCSWLLQSTGTGTPTNTTPYPTVSSVALRKMLQTNCGAYLDSLPVTDGWWLIETPPPNDINLAYSLETALTNVQNAILRMKGASPLADEIANTYQNFFMTVYMSNTSVHTYAGIRKVSLEDLRSKQEICFIPREEFGRHKFVSILSYSPHRKAVMVGCVDFSEPFFSGVLSHELGHAYRHRQGTNHIPHTIGQHLEEVEMHELEAKVMDRQTKGAYSGLLKQIVSKYPDAKTPEELLASVSPQDFIALDKVIGLEFSPFNVRSLACMEHMSMLGFVYIDRKSGSVEDKVKHYRWLIGK